MTDERRLSTSDIAAADRHDTNVAERDRNDQLRQEEERQADAARSERPDQHGWTDAPTPLFADDELGGYRARWSAIRRPGVGASGRTPKFRPGEDRRLSHERETKQPQRPYDALRVRHRNRRWGWRGS